MIAENVADLIDRVKSVSALTASASIFLGGHGTDPALLKIPLPAAWVRYEQDSPDEAPYSTSSGAGPAIVPASQVCLAMCSVIIYVPYVSESDLLTTQYPLLEQVIAAIHGKDAPSGHRWRYFGQKIALVANDRMAYQQRYTLDMVL